jgi:hypothetical protein
MRHFSLVGLAYVALQVARAPTVVGPDIDETRSSSSTKPAPFIGLLTASAALESLPKTSTDKIDYQKLKGHEVRLCAQH